MIQIVAYKSVKHLHFGEHVIFAYTQKKREAKTAPQRHHYCARICFFPKVSIVVAIREILASGKYMYVIQYFKISNRECP